MKPTTWDSAYFGGILELSYAGDLVVFNLEELRW